MDGKIAFSDPVSLGDEVEVLRAALSIMRERVAELEHLADTDTLTPLANRRAFQREVERSIHRLIRYGENSALLFIDVNGLKSVNDSHGHLAGDAMILHVARELRARVRASDVVARLGGDEFAIVLTQSNESAAAIKGAALVGAIAETTVDIGSTLLPVRLSYGVAGLNEGDSVDSALNRADLAMYAARAAQRSER